MKKEANISSENGIEEEGRGERVNNKIIDFLTNSKKIFSISNGEEFGKISINTSEIIPFSSNNSFPLFSCNIKLNFD